jgi:hypothetical protein
MGKYPVLGSIMVWRPGDPLEGRYHGPNSGLCEDTGHGVTTVGKGLAKTEEPGSW